MKMNRRINYIHYKALRIVYGDCTSSFKELLLKDNSVCIHHRNIQKVAIEMFKVKETLNPEIVRSLFNKNDNSKSNKTFHRPNVNTVYLGEYSLRSFGPIVWDSMVPDEIKSIATLEEFKREIGRWLPDNCPCRLCKEYLPNLGFVKLFE